MRLMSSEITLQDKQGEPGRDHQSGGPDDQAAGAVRHLTALEGVNEDRPGKQQDGKGHRHQKEEDAQDVNPGLAAF